MAASDRLREMRAQMEAQSAELLGEESGATEISIGGTKLKLDDEDRKTLLRRPTTQVWRFPVPLYPEGLPKLTPAHRQARPGELSTCRICTVIAVTVVACLALLWALFHGGTPQFVRCSTDQVQSAIPFNWG